MKKEKRQSNNKKNKPWTIEKDSKKILLAFFLIGIPSFIYLLTGLLFDFKCQQQGSDIKFCQFVDETFMQRFRWGLYSFSTSMLGIINGKMFYKKHKEKRDKNKVHKEDFER